MASSPPFEAPTAFRSSPTTDEKPSWPRRDSSQRGRALAPSVPTFDFLTDALHATGAEVVVAPTGLDHPRLLDRLQGSDDVEAKVRDRIGDHHLVVVEPNGSFRIA